MVGLLCTVGPACANLVPSYIVWQGTLEDSLGRTSVVRAHARLVERRDRCAEFFGRFRCYGVGCPLRRGRVSALPMFISESVAGMYLERRHVFCGYGDITRTDFSVEGAYRCFTKGVMSHLLSEGTIALVPTELGPPVPAGCD